MSIFEQEPFQVERKERSVTFDWLIGETEGREGTKRHFVTYTVRYEIGGMNYFSGRQMGRSYRGNLTFEVEERGKVFTSRSFTLGSGLGGVYVSEPVKRFSQKQIPVHAKLALERLREVADDDRIQTVVAEAFDQLARAQAGEEAA